MDEYFGPVPPVLDTQPAPRRRRKRRDRFGIAIAAGFTSAVVGALVWAVFAGIFQLRLGVLAIGVGSLVGYSVKRSGRGRTELYGVIAMVAAGFGCFLGDFFGGTVMLTLEYDLSLFRVLDRMNLELARVILFEMITFLDVVFYLIAMLAAYRIAVIVE